MRYPGSGGAARRRQEQQGAALILTLVTVVVLGTIAAGIGTLVVGHVGRARTDQDAARALHLAEAALNYQIQRVSAVGLSAPQAKYVGTNGAAASYGAPPVTVFPLAWASGSGNPQPLPIPAAQIAHGGGNLASHLNLQNLNAGNGVADAWVSWIDPDLDIYSQTTQLVYGAATVNGVTRVVRAKGGAKGVFDDHALFGIQRVDLNGNFTINGTVGSNGAISVGGSSAMDGISLYGPGASFSGGGGAPTPERFPAAIAWPAITTIANQVAQGLTADAGKPGYYGGLPTGNGILNFSAGKNDNALGAVKSGANWVTGIAANGGQATQNSSLKLVGKPWGANYYLDNFEGKVDIAADISGGPVTLWINTTKDTPAINATSKIRAYNGSTNPSILDAQLTLDDAKLFKIYYVNRKNPLGSGTLNINGVAQFYAMLYAYDVIGGTPVGKVELNGGSTFNGSIIAYDIPKGNGNATINYPSNPGISLGEGLLFYGWVDPWHEVNPVRGN
ncbi:MAG TPA: hypothetical protein VM490_00210 [Armatimonadaceae bacterium]|nr:hypothetical protein [Armatimonadaceae bacterium]